MWTRPTSPGAPPARSSAALIATAPRRGAGTEDSAPRKLPMGVRAAPTMTTSRMGGGYHRPRAFDETRQEGEDAVDVLAGGGPPQAEPDGLEGARARQPEREQDLGRLGGA